MFRLAISLAATVLVSANGPPPSFWAVRPAYGAPFCWGNAQEADIAISTCTQRIGKDVPGSAGLAEALTQRGFLYTHNGKPEIAIRDYDEALRLQPNYWPAVFYRAVTYARLGRYELAAADIRRVINLQPWYLRAVGLFNEKLGDPWGASFDIVYDTAIRSRMMCHAHPQMRQVCLHDLFSGSPRSAQIDQCLVCKNLH